MVLWRGGVDERSYQVLLGKPLADRHLADGISGRGAQEGGRVHGDGDRTVGVRVESVLLAHEVVEDRADGERVAPVEGRQPRQAKAQPARERGLGLGLAPLAVAQAERTPERQ